MDLFLWTVVTMACCCHPYIASVTAACNDLGTGKILLEMKDKMIEISAEMSGMKEEMSQIRDKMSQIEEDVVGLHSEVDAELHKQAKINDQIGFLAHAADRGYNAGEVVQFPTVITNTGNAYDPETGVFTCPALGLYIFSSTLFSDNDNAMRASLRTSQETLARGDSPNEWNTGIAGVAVAECAAGETVWVEAGANGDRPEAGSSTTFTGALLTIIT